MPDIRPETPDQMDGLVVIGFDSEWVEIGDTGRNHILSYQFAGITAAGKWSGIVYTDGPDEQHRLTLKDLMGRAIIAGTCSSYRPFRYD